MTNDEARMTNGKQQLPTGAGAKRARGKVYDLEERTANFGEAVIEYAQRIAVTPVTRSLIDQFVRAGTTIGANYCEADDAGSKADFRWKIGICKREARETKYWLRMIAKAAPDLKADARPLWREARDLHLIFAKIWRSSGSK